MKQANDRNLADRERLEFVRVWYKDKAKWEAEGWVLDYAKETTHSDLMGASHLDCLMARHCQRT